MPATSQPRVSVIITCYNQENFLPEAIESAIQQTVPPHEIIIADDHSTRDASVKVIQDYVTRYPGWIRGVFQETNVGIPRNRNSALQVVTGDHVAVLDGDDRLLPNYLATLTTALKQNPEAGCSYGNRYQMTATGERHRIWNTVPQPSGDVFAYLAAGRTGRLRSLVVRYDLVKAAGFFDDRFFHQDGFILTLRLAKLTPFVYVPEPLMEKRDHAGGTYKTTSYHEKIQCFEDILSEIVRLGSDLAQPEMQKIRQFWLRRLAKLRILAAMQDGDKLTALSYFIKGTARDPRHARKLWSAFRQSPRRHGKSITRPT